MDVFTQSFKEVKCIHLTSAITNLSGSAAKSLNTYVTAFTVTGIGILLVPTCTKTTTYLSCDRAVKRRQDFINPLNQTAQSHTQCLWGVGKDSSPIQTSVR